MTRFGTSEVIRPLSLTRIVAEKDTYMGVTSFKVSKVADSYKPTDEQATLVEIIKAIKHLYAGNSDYSCIELFSDRFDKTKGVVTINICHMKRVK
jgi:hypothetical protein